MSSTLLLIEDDPAARGALAALLKKARYRVHTAPDGRAALDYLGSRPPPNLILLDMLLPVLDGWHFLEEIQKIKKPVAPIIVTTGTILTRKWAEDHGCAGFIHKPIDVQELLQEIQRCISGGIPKT